MGRSAQNTAAVHVSSPLKTLQNCGGYYQCPRDEQDNFLGPLVGYAGRYDDGNGNQLQYVGDVYYNFARAERFPHVRDYFASAIVNALKCAHIDFDTIIAAPMGGILLSGDIGRLADRQTVFMEKKVIKAETDTSREESHLIMDRHELQAGNEVVIGEDVVNNLSTPGKTWNILRDAGVKLVAITCAFNRSGKDHYTSPDEQRIPIICCQYIPTQQFRQDDPKVAECIKKNHWVKKPKDHWDQLAQAMSAAQKA